jgi:hypothetical protein
VFPPVERQKSKEMQRIYYFEFNQMDVGGVTRGRGIFLSEVMQFLSPTSWNKGCLGLKRTRFLVINFSKM